MDKVSHLNRLAQKPGAKPPKRRRKKRPPVLLLHFFIDRKEVRKQENKKRNNNNNKQSWPVFSTGKKTTFASIEYVAANVSGAMMDDSSFI